MRFSSIVANLVGIEEKQPVASDTHVHYETQSKPWVPKTQVNNRKQILTDEQLRKMTPFDRKQYKLKIKSQPKMEIDLDDLDIANLSYNKNSKLAYDEPMIVCSAEPPIQSRLSSNHTNKVRTKQHNNNNHAIRIAHGMRVLKGDQLNNYSKPTMAELDKEENDKLKSWSGPVFDDYQFQEVELNSALATLDWAFVPHQLANLQLITVKTNSDEDVIRYKDFKRLLSECKHIDLNSMKEKQANDIRRLFVYFYAACPEILLDNSSTHKIDLPYYEFEPHPIMRFPKLDSKHFVGKETRTAYEEPLLERNCDPTTLNVLHEFLNLCTVNSRRMTIKKFKSVMKTTTYNNTDPVEAINEMCPLLTLSMINAKPNPKHKEEEWSKWGFESLTDMRKYCWFQPFVHPDMFMYIVRLDHPKATNPFLRYSRFFSVFRSMLVNLRDALVAEAKHYVTISKLEPYQRKEYRATMREAFKSCMRTQSSQLMFLGGATKKQVTDYIFSEHHAKMRDQSEAAPQIIVARSIRQVKRAKMIISERKEKFNRIFDEQQYTETYFDDDTYECQAGLWDYAPKKQDVIWCASTAASVLCVLWISELCTRHAVYWISEFRTQATRLVNLNRVMRPVLTMNNRIQEIVTETSTYFSTIDGELSPQTQLTYVEFYTTINVIYSMIKQDYKTATRFAGLYGITRSKLVKDTLVHFAGFAPARPLIDHHHVMFAGFQYRLNLADYIEYIQLHQLYAGQELLEHIADFLDERDVVDEAQALDDLTTWIKPLSKLMSCVTDGNLDERDVRDANALYQFMNHKAQFVSEQAGLFKFILSFLGRFMYGFDPFQPEFHAFAATMYELMTFVEDTLPQRNTFSTKKALMQKVCERHEYAVKLQRDPTMGLLPTWLRTYFVKRLDQLESMNVTCIQLLKGTNVRDVPVCVLVTGPPNGGKTASSEYIRDALSDILRIPRGDQSNFIFNANNEFWEGYAGQFFCQIDDMFKHQDVAKRTIEFDLIINAINSAAFNLPMAFEGKGGSFFISQVVLCSTNIANDGYATCKWQCGATDEAAMIRRFHLIVHKTTPAVIGDTNENEFTVHKCDFMPEMVGQTVTPADIARLILMIRKRFEEQGRLKENTPEKILADFPDMDQLVDEYATGADRVRIAAYRAQREVETVDEVQANRTIPEIIEYVTMEPYEYLKRTLNIKFLDKDPDDPITIRQIQFFTGLFVVLIAATTAASIWYFKPLVEEEADETQEWYEKSKTSRGAKRLHKNVMNAKSAKGMKISQARPMVINTVQSEDCNYMLSLKNNVSSCCVNMSICEVDSLGDIVLGSGAHAWGFHYAEGVFFGPGHFVSRFSKRKNALVKLTIKWLNGEIDMMLPCMWVVPGQDIFFFRVTKAGNLPKSARKYMWTQEDMLEGNILPGTPMQLIKLTGSCTQPDIKPVTKADDYPSALNYTDDNGVRFKVDYCLNYYENTVRGESGSMLVMKGAQGTAKIIGMHVCVRAEREHKTFGFSLPFTLEGLDSLVSQLEPAPVTVDTVQSYIERVPFEPLRIAAIQHFPAFHSRLTPTVLHAWNGPPHKIPAALGIFTNPLGLKIDPLLIAYGKLRTEDTPATDLNEDEIVEYLLNTYPPYGINKGVYTWDQALQGCPEDGFNSICGTTSAGYPFNASTKLKGKFDYINLDSGIYTYKPEFLEELKIKETKLKAGEYVEFVFADGLKDETRAVDKVAQGKSRLVSCCPLDYCILFRKYFGPFLGYIRSFGGRKPCCVGINPHSMDWTDLANRLLSTSGSVLAGDFTNWDGSTPEQLAHVVRKFLCRWFDDEHSVIREMLLQVLTRAVHICFNVVFQTKGCNPTGQPATSEWNSLLLEVAYYVVLTRDYKMKVGDWNLAVYGDDNACTTIMIGLRIEHMAPHFARRFDMKLTHFSKEEGRDCVDETLADIGFIGRAWVMDDFGIYRAPLSMTTICEMFYYSASSMPMIDYLTATADSFFSELSHYPEPVFREYSKRLLTACAEMAPQYIQVIAARKRMYEYYQNERYFLDDCTLEDEVLQNNDLIFTTQSGDLKAIGTNLKPETNPNSTDRDVKLPPVTQSVELGSFNDVAEVTPGTANNVIVQEPYTGINMETFNMGDSLDRTFNVANIAWTTAQGAGTILATLKFPQLLFSQTFIADKINDMRAFVAGVRVDARITASRTLYGKLALVLIPYTEYYPVSTGTTQVFNYNTNLYNLTGHPHMLMDASSSDVVTMEAPFVNPARYLDLGKYGNAEMGVFLLVVMNPLSNSENATATATVVVTAGFIDAKVFLPTDTSNGIMMTSLKERHLEKPHSVAEKVRLTSEPVDEVQSTRSKNREGARKALMVTAENEVHESLPGALQTISLVGSAIGNLAAGAATIGALIGLSKPTTVNTATIVTSNPNFGINHGNGIETIMKASVDSENAISTKLIVGGITADEMELRFIASVPSMVTSVTNVQGSGPIQIATTGIDANLCYVDHLKMMFYYWHGSHKFKTYITASIYHSVRLVFYLATSATADWQVCYHKVVEVQGSTEVDFTIPYCPNFPAAQTTTTDVPYSLFVAQLAWSQSDSLVSTPIYLNTYKAGGSDFRVGGPRDCAYTIQSTKVDNVTYETQSCPRMDFNMDFEAIHPSITGYMQDNLLFGEEILTVREMIHKMTPMYSNITLDEPIWNITRGSTASLTGVDMWGLFYRFWRGGVKYKLMQKVGQKYRGLFQSAPNSTTGYFHGFGVSAPNMNSCEADFPYYEPVLFETTCSVALKKRQITSPGTDSAYILKGCSDDFSFHWLMLPPQVYMSTAQPLRAI